MWPKAYVLVADNSFLNFSSLIVCSGLTNIPSLQRFYFCLLAISLLGDFSKLLSCSVHLFFFLASVFHICLDEKLCEAGLFQNMYL